jgi:membrane protease YdiL (CAAX protease family)
MGAESKSLNPARRSGFRALFEETTGSERAHSGGLGDVVQIGLVFGLIMIALWTPPGRVNAACNVLAALGMVGFSVWGGCSADEMGLGRPVSGAVVMVVCGLLMVLAVAVAGSVFRSLEPPQTVPWGRAWKYGIWALEQEFILQSFFYVRLESLLGSRRAVWAAALLFCAAHLPSPLLTAMSFIGGALFCEMFRRYRNIYPLGLIHAAVGLTIAASLPDRVLHHMRVGLGYLTYRS